MRKTAEARPSGGGRVAQASRQGCSGQKTLRVSFRLRFRASRPRRCRFLVFPDLLLFPRLRPSAFICGLILLVHVWYFFSRLNDFRWFKSVWARLDTFFDIRKIRRCEIP